MESPKKVDPYQFTIILDKLPAETTVANIEEALKATSFNFKAVEKIDHKDFDKFGIESPLSLARNNRLKPVQNNNASADQHKIYFLVTFENKDDLNTIAHSILFEKTIRIGTKKLHLKLHTKRGNYNPETSLCIS